MGLILLAVSSLFYFENGIFKDIYNETIKNFKNFVARPSKIISEISDKADIGDIISGIKKEILMSTPLDIGGAENQAVLTRAKIISETNIQRYNNGLLVPLIENPKLNIAAESKARDMFDKQYFEHVSPSGDGPDKVVQNANYDYVIIGENLILGNFKDEKELVQLWMDSPGHRANILNIRFSEIGVAILKGSYKDKTVWIGVQEFGLPASVCSQPDNQIKNYIESNKITLDQLSAKIDAKKEEIDNTNPKLSQYNVLVEEYNKLAEEYNSINQEIKKLIIQYNGQVDIFNRCITGE